MSTTIETNRAFTLIELLIVVSIISILAVIAVPNFLEAQTRARVARAKSDMRTLATGLESFFADHKHYPNATNADSISTRPRGSITYSIISNDLTTPVAYLTNLEAIEDAFAEDTPDNVSYSVYPVSKQYWYDVGEGWWLLFSKGPDMVFLKLAPDLVGSVSYDPTNGSISYGDIFRSQKDPDHKKIPEWAPNISPSF